MTKKARTTKVGTGLKGRNPSVPRPRVSGQVLQRESKGRDVVALYETIASILEDARARVVRTINSEMVLAYWHVGRAIVEHVQAGATRADYGRQVIEELASRLTERFGGGFSSTNLRYFRTFYLVYADRTPSIRHLPGGELDNADKSVGRARRGRQIRHLSGGALAALAKSVAKDSPIQGFSSELGWTHYRTLMKVEHAGARASPPHPSSHAFAWHVATA